MHKTTKFRGRQTVRHPATRQALRPVRLNAALGLLKAVVGYERAYPGHACPSHAKLGLRAAQAVGRPTPYTRRHVIRLQAELLEAGWLDRDRNLGRQRNGRNDHRTNAYRVTDAGLRALGMRRGFGSCFLDQNVTPRARKNVTQGSTTLSLKTSLTPPPTPAPAAQVRRTRAVRADPVRLAELASAQPHKISNAPAGAKSKPAFEGDTPKADDRWSWAELRNAVALRVTGVVAVEAIRRQERTGKIARWPWKRAFAYALEAARTLEAEGIAREVREYRATPTGAVVVAPPAFRPPELPPPDQATAKAGLDAIWRAMGVRR